MADSKNGVVSRPSSTPLVRDRTSVQGHQAKEASEPDVPALALHRPIMPGSFSPREIAQLQRIIGNRAVQRNVTGTATPPGRPASAVPTRQTQGNAPMRPASAAGNIMSLLQFEAAIMDAARMPIRTARMKADANLPEPTPQQMAAQRTQLLQPILRDYQAYEADPSMPNMIKLHSRIDQWITMWWNAGPTRDAGLRNEEVKATLEQVKASIDIKVRAETVKQGGAADTADTLLAAGGQKAKAPKRIAFFDQVGVSPAYYSTLKSNHVKLYQKLYKALEAGNRAHVTLAIDRLAAANIPGFNLVKGLFLTAFPKIAGIDHFYDPNYRADDATKQTAFRGNLILNNYSPEDIKNEKYAGDMSGKRAAMGSALRGLTDSKDLSDAELAVLSAYTGGVYAPMNGLLRSNKAEDVTNLGLETSKKNAVLVSALNKLPAYSGTAYRMQNAFADFDAAVKPGGMYTDLAFMSASSTLQGAEDGGASGGASSAGALEVYMIIHTTSAANIGFMSALKNETEVLFKPGVRFKVDAIWTHENGKVPVNAPQEAKMILNRTGEIKTKTSRDGRGNTVQSSGKVRVIELTQT